MGVPDDANPLNRRLPAEVVSRRRKVEKKEKEETPLTVDRGQVMAMKPEQRVKWLLKVIQGCQEGRITPNTIYDVVAHTKFGSDVPPKVGLRMYRLVRSNLSLFSSKQQRYLEHECKLAQRFKDEDGEPEAPAAPVPTASTTEELGADSTAKAVKASGCQDAETSNSRAKAVVEVETISDLWDRLTKLTPEARAEAVDALDPSMKERLEQFLVARIGARDSSASNGQNGDKAEGGGDDSSSERSSDSRAGAAGSAGGSGSQGAPVASAGGGAKSSSLAARSKSRSRSPVATRAATDADSKERGRPEKRSIASSSVGGQGGSSQGGQDANGRDKPSWTRDRSRDEKKSEGKSKRPESGYDAGRRRGGSSSAAPTAGGGAAGSCARAAQKGQRGGRGRSSSVSPSAHSRSPSSACNARACSRSRSRRHRRKSPPPLRRNRR